jgi:transposase
VDARGKNDKIDASVNMALKTLYGLRRQAIDNAEIFFMSAHVHKIRTVGENLLRRLRQQADLLRQWHCFELGQPAPEPLDYAALAHLLDEAVARIEKLERDR